jgi:hypothetical protein
MRLRFILADEHGNVVQIHVRLRDTSVTQGERFGIEGRRGAGEPRSRFTCRTFRLVRANGQDRALLSSSENWRRRPPDLSNTRELIGHTQTTTGLHVTARLDKRGYPTVVVVTPTDMRAIAMAPATLMSTRITMVRARGT